MKGAGFEPHCRLVYPAHILEPDAQNPLPALVSVFTIYPMISNLGVGTPLGVFLWRVSTGGCGSVRKGAARIAFPPPKVGVTRTEPYSFPTVSQYSSVGVLRC